MRNFLRSVVLAAAVLSAASLIVHGQTVPVKKNERPGGSPAETSPNPADAKAKAQSDNSDGKEPRSQYRYEFSQPDFIVSHITIEHDWNGKGKITFERKESEGSVTDPIQLSPLSLENLRKILDTLNFLDSIEDYQSPIRSYGHLGNFTVTVSTEKKSRTAKYNWSENLDARKLTSEYQKISEQYVWLFDMSVSLANQPLEAPSLMDRLESLLQRGEISDPPQLLPHLREFTNDERIPLIARNHAARLAKSIEKKLDK